MSLFLAIFVLIYGGMHLYTFLKAKSSLSFGLPIAIPLAVFMLLMILSPVFVRLLEKADHELSARMLAYVGYVWMGLLVIFISIAFATDLYRLLIHITAPLAKKDLTAFIPAPRITFYATFILSLLICFYGYFEAKNIKAERLTIKTNKIPKEMGQIKIVQISDVHVGLIVREKRINKIVEIIKREKPDILISTGDLVDGVMADVDGLSSLISSIETVYGKYAVTGNHEFYAGLGHALDFTKKAGFVVLRGAGATVSGILNIAGVDDSAGIPSGQSKIVDEGELLSTLPRDKFTLLLKHRPEVDEKAIGLFDLQLSGHTHNGQIFPFTLLVKFSYEKLAGLYLLEKGSKIYTSRGTGTWGPPIRFLSPPEVTIITLVYEEGK